ncbi:MAG TPA: chloride transporter [Dermacoccus sp.]|uniref:chorismate-binding protein n=1 Tax=Dermacoccus sp. SAI-028 TaxID=2768432 RepID=UPI000EBD6003|nr:chorismate-binding protein [Dermacoccus sp. SAI-028]HCQ19198.1 chloride transporter [Dermacoccus sp.]
MIDALAASTDRALFRDVTAWDVEAVTSDPDDLEHGFHVVVQTFEGELLAARMRSVVRHPTQPWRGSAALAEPPSRPAECDVEWRSSLSRDAYCDGVGRIREHIAAGDVYQVNLCRTLTTDAALDLDVLFRGVLAHNPARHAARIDIAGLPQIVSASPEMYLAREGAVISSAPIKGTSTCPETMLAKDATENVMITDLVRNDLQRVCVPGSVRVDPLLEMQQHPGLVHLVSTVWGEVCDDVTWARLLSATGPPGSVSGTPKLRALDVIESLEVGARGPYCGAIGWIDADRGAAELAVGIRTFWQKLAGGGAAAANGHGISSPSTHFGVGAGITWDSVPTAEWDETELKAHRLLAIARGAALEETP